MYAGKKLKEVRQHLGFNQEEFSQALNISQSYYSAMESGKKEVTEKIMRTISEKYEINLGFFYADISLKSDVLMGGNNGGVSGGKNISTSIKEKIFEKKIREQSIFLGEFIEKNEIALNSRNTYDLRSKASDKLLLDLEQNNKELFDLLKLIKRVSVRIDILEDAFSCYVNSIPDVIDTASITDIQIDRNQRHGVYNIDYKKYKDDVINYLSNLEKYKEAINHYQNETDKFLKILKPLDEFGLII